MDLSWLCLVDNHAGGLFKHSVVCVQGKLAVMRKFYQRVGDFALGPAGGLPEFGDLLENIFHRHLTIEVAIGVQAKLFRR